VEDVSTGAAEGHRVKGLRGQRAVILGGTAGIGLATAKAAAHYGAEVVADTQREKIRLTRQDGEQDDVSVELLRAGRQRGVTSM